MFSSPTVVDVIIVILIEDFVSIWHVIPPCVFNKTNLQNAPDKLANLPEVTS
jgi:hypothetical protein